MTAIADTGFLVAFASRRDAHHHWAKELAGLFTEPLLTCEAVLAECAFHLGSVTVAMEFVRSGLVRLAFSLAENSAEIAALAERYSDQAPDLADLCLIRMSELNPRHRVITTDVKDFSVYRRGRRDPIALIHP